MVVFSFLIIPLIILIFYLSLKGLGFFFFKILFYDKNSANHLIYPVLAFPLLFFISTTIHLFFRLDPLINLLILVFGFFIYLKNFKIEINLKLLILILIFSIQFYGHNVNEDYGYYHLPYIINFISEKLIFGLYHLSMVQGYNSAWLNTGSTFYLPFFFDKTVHFANTLLIISVILFYLNFILKEKNISTFPISTIYGLIAITFFITKNSRLNSFGVDVPGHIYASIVLFFFINFCENKDYYFRKTCFYLITLFSAFCILIKLSYVPLVIFPFLCLVANHKLLDKRIFIFSLIFILPWIIQQVAYTSCIIFPVNYTCISSLPWHSKQLILDASFGLEVINKSVWNYEGVLSYEEYAKNFNWLSTWFFRNVVELLENIFTFTIPILILIIYNLIKSKKITISHPHKFLYLALIPIILGFLIWFLKAPVARYGIFYINSILFFIFLIIFKNFLLNSSKKTIFLILVISLTFNLSKNLIRIINIETYEDYPFPYKEKIIYKTKVINKFNLHTPIMQSTNQSSVCWDTPILCRVGEFDDLEIGRNKGYIVINKK